MRHEFNNRMAAQRSILQVVNSEPWAEEALFGLSSKAIDRWVACNHIDPSSILVKLIKDAAQKLFFLASKSQEQISEQYKVLAAELAGICQEIETEIRSMRAGR